MTVFAVQNTFISDGGRLVPRFDLTPAAEYGDVQFLLSPTAKPYRPEKILEELHDGLMLYNPNRDYVLPLGNPCLIGMVVAIAAWHGGGTVRMLQWDARAQRYAVVSATLWLP